MADGINVQSEKPFGVNNIKTHVPIMLGMDGLNYDAWRELLETHCHSFGVFGHLDGSTVPTGPTDTYWTRVDGLVKLWIYGTISQSLLTTVFKKKSTAHDLWTRLEHQFRDNKEDRAIQLDNELRTLAIGDLSVHNYCQKLKKIADLLANIDVEVPERTLVMHMLNGLNEKLDNIVNVIKRRNPFPSFDEARSMRSLEEQRLSKSIRHQPVHANHSSAPTALYTASTLPTPSPRPPQQLLESPLKWREEEDNKRSLTSQDRTTGSSTQPRLLLTFQTVNNKYVFFSLPQPQNSDKESESESVCVASCHMMFSTVGFCGRLHPLRSLICCGNRRQLQICNPTTKQTVALPPTPLWPRGHMTSYFGYDPINDEYKVLCVFISCRNYKKIFVCEEHQVLTLGTGQSWRRIEGSPHHPTTKAGICINGVLYYGAWYGMKTDKIRHSVLVSFDVRSEKFNVIELPEDEGIESFWSCFSTLINYKGKLACGDFTWFGTIGGPGVKLWVLDNAEKNEWSKKVFVFPPSGIALVGPGMLSLAGAIDTGEIVLDPHPSHRVSFPLYILCWDLERNAIRRVEVKGIEENELMRQEGLPWSDRKLTISTDYVESIMLL